MKEPKFYLNNQGYLIMIEQNLCGCHPFNIIVTWSKTDFSKGDSLSYDFQNQQQINGFVRRRNWERLK